MLFSRLKHYLDTDTTLKVSQSVYCFTASISYGVENYFPGCGVWASLMLFKRPARDACLCMGELPAPPAPHFVFLITL